MDTVDIDPNFEPQQRARSNTWPLPRPDNYPPDKDDVGGGAMGGVAPGDVGMGGGMLGATAGGVGAGAGHLPKKSSSRRNAWGNMSYADLITQAIQSSADKRLTLSQIYDWMVQNVPYFKDKGDSNSSAGWKNSIRHNLSLHNRFMRVQNEGTGKSSWWMINPDAKPGKAARRRATSMETQKYEKKRGRVKKKVDAIRSGIDATPSPSSSISESLDMFPDSPRHHAFQLSPDFRPRASSNASSCGRLSPIPVEPDMHDSQVPPMSPGPWSNAGSQADLFSGDRYGADQLVDTLTETMKLGGSVVGPSPSQHQNAATPPVGSPAVSVSSPSSASGAASSASANGNGLKPSPPSSVGQLSPLGHLALNGFNGVPSSGGGNDSVTFADFHSPYAESPKIRPLQRSPQRMMTDNGGLGVSSSYSLTNLQALSPAHSVHSMSPPQSVDVLGQSPTPPPSAPPPGSGPGPNASSQQQPLFGDQALSSQSGAYAVSAPANNQSPATYCALTGHQTPDSAMLRAVLSHKDVAVAGGGGDLNAVIHRSNSLGQNGSGAIRLAHLHHLQQQQQQQQHQQHHQQQQHHHHQVHHHHHQHQHQQQQQHHQHHHVSGGPSTMMGQLLAFNSGMPNDLDLTLETLQGGLECDVDQVIRHELSVDGILDFNVADPSSLQAAVAATNGQQWVH